MDDIIDYLKRRNMNTFAFTSLMKSPIYCMRGLMNLVNWRTFLTGFFVGYLAAWGIHWAVTFYTTSGAPQHEKIPLLTPAIR